MNTFKDIKDNCNVYVLENGNIKKTSVKIISYDEYGQTLELDDNTLIYAHNVDNRTFKGYFGNIKDRYKILNIFIHLKDAVAELNMFKQYYKEKIDELNVIYNNINKTLRGI